MSQYQILTCRSNPIRIIRCAYRHRIFWKPCAVRLAEYFIRIIRILDFKHTLIYTDKKIKKTYACSRA